MIIYNKSSLVIILLLYSMGFIGLLVCILFMGIYI